MDTGYLLVPIIHLQIFIGVCVCVFLFFLQEAVIREQVLETKLGSLQRIVSATREAAEMGWTALMEEDRLLTRIESLENQLIVSSKVITAEIVAYYYSCIQDTLTFLKRIFTRINYAKRFGNCTKKKICIKIFRRNLCAKFLQKRWKP